MELNWTTFVLELINFLILVWILKRFLYRPVLDIISRRQQSIRETLADAQQTRSEADQLKDQYAHRISDWEEERQQARERLYTEIDDERTRRMDELHKQLKLEADRARTATAHRLEDATRKIEQTAMDQAAAFGSRLLTQLAGPDLELRLLDLVVEEFKTMSTEKTEALRAGWKKANESIAVDSVWPLPDDARKRLEQALHQSIDAQVTVRFAQDPQLIAGLRIVIGDWVMHANLRDELHNFAEQAHAG